MVLDRCRDITMATTQKPKLPRITRNHCHNDTIVGSKLHRSPGQKTDLPGIGSYVIDSPEDKNMGVRQQCLRYQESHRGIIRARIESLPDIPKRCHLKSVPVVTLKDSPSMTGSPMDVGRDTPPRSRSISGQNSPEELTFGRHRSRKDGKLFQHYMAKESAAKIPPPQEELVSRSPIGRLSQSLPCMSQAGVPITGFGVRKPKQTGRDFGNFRKEYTNLSVNVELAEPSHVTCKATERELNSQADYRRQLTFYLTPVNPPDQGREKGECGGSGSREDANANSSVLRNIPKEKIGSSTRHQIWASNVSVGQLLVQQNTATPGLRRKLEASRTKSVSVLGYSGYANKSKNNNPNTSSLQTCGTTRPLIYGSPWNRFRTFKDNSNKVCGKKKGYKRAGDGDDDEEYGDEEEDDSDEEVWLNMADMPLIETGVYDRYANVKLPRCRVPHAGTART